MPDYGPTVLVSGLYFDYKVVVKAGLVTLDGSIALSKEGNRTWCRSRISFLYVSVNYERDFGSGIYRSFLYICLR